MRRSTFEKLKKLGINFDDNFEKEIVESLERVNNKKTTQYITSEEDLLIPNFGAGFLRKKNHEEKGYYHGDIEMEALTRLGFSEQEVYKVYYGNWLRDFSQMIVAFSVRPSKEELEKIKTRFDNIKNYPQKSDDKFILSVTQHLFSQDTWVEILKILAIKEFVYDIYKSKKTDSLFKFYTQNYPVLDKDVLGIYRPEEHIDNPKFLQNHSIYSYVKANYPLQKTKDNKKYKFLYQGEHSDSLVINKGHKAVMIDHEGLKQYIFKDNFFSTQEMSVSDYLPYRPSSTSYFKEQLIEAVKKGKSKEGLMHLGNALHVLEDYYAHSNYVETLLIMIGEIEVFPWVGEIKETNFEYDASKPDEEFNKRIVALNSKLNSAENRAAHIPIVTGYFELADMFASVLPKLAETFFSIEFEKYVLPQKGERTFIDLLTLAILDDRINNENAVLLNESFPIGFNFKKIKTLYLKYLELRDLYIEFKNNFIGSYYLNFMLHYIKEGFKIFNNFIFNIILEATDDVIKAYQSRIKFKLANKELGTNPSHSQVGKDQANHPLNLLAGQIAVEAVYQTSKVVSDFWNGKIKDYNIISELSKIYFSHPITQDFTSEKLKNIKFITETFIEKYPKKIEKAKSKDQIEHIHKQFEKNILNDTETKEFFKQLDELNIEKIKEKIEGINKTKPILG